MATNVYVDGFNFYNGMFKRGRLAGAFKWVDFGAVAKAVWPNLPPVHRVRYFTALVKPTTQDPQMLIRQQIYLRALVASGVDIHYGQFKIRSKKWFFDALLSQLPASTGISVLDAVVKVAKYDEKGSDVNLASYLLRDAALHDYSDAVVISNDSDLAEAINIARNDFGVNVYGINPHSGRAAAELRKVATDIRELMPSTVQRSQLNSQIPERPGVVLSKPAAWV